MLKLLLLFFFSVLRRKKPIHYKSSKIAFELLSWFLKRNVNVRISLLIEDGNIIALHLVVLYKTLEVAFSVHCNAWFPHAALSQNSS